MDTIARFLSLGGFVAFSAAAAYCVDQGLYGAALMLTLTAMFFGAAFLALVFSKESE